MGSSAKKDKVELPSEVDQLASKMAQLVLDEGWDILELQRKVMGRVLSKALEGELEYHLGYGKGELPPADQTNRRNGSTTKGVRTSLGAVQIKVPRDREGTFEPHLVPKYRRSVAHFDRQVLALYARGMSVRDIQRTLEELYGAEVSPELISRVTASIKEELEQWRSRPLERLYYVVYIDALIGKTRERGPVSRRTLYTVVGITEAGEKDVLGLYIADSESAKYWMGVLEDLRNRGVERIGVVAADGLLGLAEAVEAVFPKAVFQTCVVHLIRNSVRLVPWKDRKALCADLRRLYTAGNVEEAQRALAAFKDKWDAKYPMVAKKWEDRWEEWIPFLGLPPEARRVIYTTNAIEALHRQLRKVIKNRGAFPSDEALLKVVYLAVRDTMKSWQRPSTYWGKARVQLAIHFGLVEV
jgi:putative transposase